MDLLDSDDDSVGAQDDIRAKEKKNKKTTTKANPLLVDESKERLSINSKFASKFEKEEKIKELRSLKSKYGANEDDDDDESDSETEDEDAELLSTALNTKIIKTINMLRQKDPKIYDKNTVWCNSSDEEESDEDEDKAGKGKSQKKKVYKDVIREQLLKENRDDIDKDDRDFLTRQHGVEESIDKNRLVYDEEQEKMRQDFLKATHDDDDEDDDDDSDDGDDDLFVSKGSSKGTSNQANKLKIEQEKVLALELKKMKELGANKSKVEEQEKEEFLTNYITNKMWLDKTSTVKGEESSDEGSLDYENEEQELNQVDVFESKYNFRYEEMVGSEAGAVGMQVQSYARNVPDSMRQKDDKRKQQRDVRKERKEKEKRQREAELRRLKNLKKEELKNRLKRIAQIGGLKVELDDDDNDDKDDKDNNDDDKEEAEEEEGEGAAEGEGETADGTKKRRKSRNRNKSKVKNRVLDALDDDWDPDQHAAMMAQEFGDDYYNDDDDNFKPEMDPELEALMGEEDGEEYNDGGEEYDNDNDYEDDGYMEKGGRDSGKLPPSLMDELYKLDYEDEIAGIQCRFKYREVEPEDFGLTIEDILLADDKELNSFVSLKHLSAYKQRNWSKHEGELSKKRKRLRVELKERRMEAEREAGELKEKEDREAENGRGKGKEKRKQRKKGRGGEEEEGEGEEEIVDKEAVEVEETENGDEGDDGAGKKRRRRRKKTEEKTSPLEGSSVAVSSSVEDLDNLDADPNVGDSISSDVKVKDKGDKGEKKGTKKNKKTSKVEKKAPSDKERRFDLYK